MLGVYCDACKPSDIPLRVIVQVPGKTIMILGWVGEA